MVDGRIDGFLEAYKQSAKIGVKLCFGLKLCVCADMEDRTPESRRTESKIVVLIKDSQGYSDIIRIWNRAWGYEGSFTHRGATYGRADWNMLKRYWTEHLGLALPYFSSFVARNTLTFSSITPDLPERPWVLKEVGSGLPFAPLIDAALERYTEGDASMVVPSKTILYPDPSWMRAYVVFRAMAQKGTFDKPEVAHLSSDTFSFAAWRELNGVVTPPAAPPTIAPSHS